MGREVKSRQGVGWYVHSLKKRFLDFFAKLPGLRRKVADTHDHNIGPPEPLETKKSFSPSLTSVYFRRLFFAASNS
jgi:hypothetical protein